MSAKEMRCRWAFDAWQLDKQVCMGGDSLDVTGCLNFGPRAGHVF
jgi:hypothetical protein